MQQARVMRARPAVLNSFVLAAVGVRVFMREGGRERERERGRERERESTQIMQCILGVLPAAK